MPTISSTITKRLWVLLPAALLAGGALTGSALIDPATACAAPREWDVGAYDSCLGDLSGTGIKDEKELEYYLRLCCTASGGDWNAGTGRCQAPPAESAGEQQVLAPAVISPGVPTATLTPAPPPTVRNPGNITGTFAPAPTR